MRNLEAIKQRSAALAGARSYVAKAGSTVEMTEAERAERRREQKRASAQRRRDRDGYTRPKPEITYAQAGAVVGVSRQRIEQLVKLGELPKPLTRAAVESYAAAYRAKTAKQSPE